MTAEKNRLEHASKAVVSDVKSMVRLLEKRIEKLDVKIRETIATDPEQRENYRRLQTVPGIGPKVAQALVVDLPELGQLDRRRISSLVGLAPYAQDSGQKRGSRRIHGGRSGPRTQLYLAAMIGSRFNPELKVMYERLIAKGKPPKVAYIALARKMLTILNAIVRDQSEWRSTMA